MEKARIVLKPTFRTLLRKAKINFKDFLHDLEAGKIEPRLNRRHILIKIFLRLLYN